MFAAQQNALFGLDFESFDREFTAMLMRACFGAAPVRRVRRCEYVAAKVNADKIAASAALQADLFASVQALHTERREARAVRDAVARLLADGDRVFSLDDLCAEIDLDRACIARNISKSVANGSLQLWLLGEGYYAPTTMGFIAAENEKDQIIEDREIFSKPKVDTDALVADAIAAQRANVLSAWF